MTRVSVRAELLDWAMARAGVDEDDLTRRFPRLSDWRSGGVSPTVRQLEAFSRATHTPFGFFFLEEPPVEKVPIPDFRTIRNARIGNPSPDLLDTIYVCQQRQDWYRQNAILQGEEPLDFIGSATLQSDVAATAGAIRRAVDFDLSARAEAATFVDALRMMIEAADQAGVLVMVSGIVRNNTHRPLDPGEFRGFALSDDLAPLVFINGADTKSGQMFTLAHELAHLWLGESGVSDVTPASAPPPRNSIEQWCNAVAAEVLVPMASFRVVYRPSADLQEETRRLSRHYKVSTLVILRRMLDAGGLSRDAFAAAFATELAFLKEMVAQRKREGGDYYATTTVRVSERFARAVLGSTWEGRSTFTEAFRLLGVRNVRTLERLGERLGMTEYLRGGAV